MKTATSTHRSQQQQHPKQRAKPHQDQRSSRAPKQEGREQGENTVSAIQGEIASSTSQEQPRLGRRPGAPIPLKLQPARAINYRLSEEEMLPLIDAIMPRPQSRITLLYLLLHIQLANAQSDTAPSADELIFGAGHDISPASRRWVRHLLGEALEAGLIAKDHSNLLKPTPGNGATPANTRYAILPPGLHYIQLARATRMRLWKINPRAQLESIHAIVSSEENNHPLHYNTTMQRHGLELELPVAQKERRRTVKTTPDIPRAPGHLQALMSATSNWVRT